MKITTLIKAITGKRIFPVLLGIMLTASTAVANQKNIPILNMGYVFTTHHTPLMVAAIKGEEFKASGAYLEPMVPKMSRRNCRLDRN